ncbi:protein translocase SEC61 complex subunit gamma [Candidatus Bathyarchaeota archaeon]|nr:protein translocase SEC61 complex subunit gamma [Candidatus Bathyarchaeota archaeon]
MWWNSLGLRSFIKSSLRLLRLARKPSRDEIWLSMRICFLGILIVGAIGFIVYFLAGVLRSLGV